ncbi:MAG: polyphosphate:AMP phosphotransferase [Rhodocyclaceae bacterium]|nr:polyphosphate:AMP phosphotransferase [Rhodocyclaceae bacterium]
MFESAELGHKVDDATYARRVKKLRADLLDAQYDLKQSGAFAVLVLINGLDGAGKSETVNLFNEWMDPRHIETRAFPAPSDEARQRPPLWRYWQALPPRGKIGIFFGNWYTDPIVERAMRKSERSALPRGINDIQHLEKMLADEGVLLIKYWFHLSEKGQEKRLRKLAKNPRTAWRVTSHDWKLFKRYKPYVSAAERILRETDSAHAPWTLIDGSDENYRELAAGEHLLAQLKRRLADAAAAESTSAAKNGRKTAVKPATSLDRRNVLNSLDMSKHLSDRKYGRELEKWQGQLNLLARHPKFRERSAVLVFEGMDAAGKGGAIRRVTAALDARHYRNIPIAAPTEEERAQPYLWRFWRHLPGHGQIAIFDRSWYGRVLVERVEGFCSEADWMRAYSEINDFERQLVDSGTVISKFWLSVSADEQLRRFKEREETRFKRFKITPDDWRNRDKWPSYEVAVCDMVDRTSTDIAPWHLIAADDKNHARIAILKTVCECLESAL